MLLDDGLTTTLNGEFSVYGDILLENGSILELNETSEIRMGPDSRIIVKDGCSLVANGALISSACDLMWRGIEVWERDQSTSDAGTVHLENCSVLDAHIGILDGRYLNPNEDLTGLQVTPEYFELDSWGSSIFLSGNLFENCGIGVYRPDFSSLHPKDANITIIGNHFITSAELLNYGYDLDHWEPLPNNSHPWFGYANGGRRGYAGVILGSSKNNIIGGSLSSDGNSFENPDEFLEAEQLSTATTIDTNHPDGPYPMYLTEIADEAILYEITYINPFTGDSVEIETQMCQLASTEYDDDIQWRIPLDYPPLGIYNDDSPVYLFHARPLPFKSNVESQTKNHKELSVKIFPNPTNDVLRMKITGERLSEKMICTIHSITGEKVIELCVSHGLNQIDVSEIAVGMYSLQIIDFSNETPLHKDRIIIVK